MGPTLLKIYVIAIACISLFSLIYVYAFPPESMRYTRDGALHFTPAVLHPETGETVPVDVLIRHYKGE